MLGHGKPIDENFLPYAVVNSINYDSILVLSRTDNRNPLQRRTLVEPVQCRESRFAKMHSAAGVRSFGLGKRLF